MNTSTPLSKPVGRTRIAGSMLLLFFLLLFVRVIPVSAAVTWKVNAVTNVSCTNAKNLRNKNQAGLLVCFRENRNDIKSPACFRVSRYRVCYTAYLNIIKHLMNGFNRKM